MNVSSPLRCLFAKSVTQSRFLRQSFHSSHALFVDQEPKQPSDKSTELGLANQGNKIGTLRPYSKEEEKRLAQIYTPEQLAAIKAGEAAVDLTDLVNQGAFRDDPFGLPYIDDLSEIHPVVDKPVRAPESNHDPSLRFKEEDEIAEDLVDWMQKLPDEPSRLDWMKYKDNVRLMVGKEEAERNSRSYLSPELPKIKSLQPRKNEDGNKDIDPRVRRLMLQTGYTAQQIKRFRVKVLVTHRVVNQTKLGKIQSMYYLAIAGNGRGLVGIGEGKSTEPEDAKVQATLAAVRNLVPVPRYEDRTIFGDVRGKVGATELQLMTRPPGNISSPLHPKYFIQHHETHHLSGFGLRCQSLIHEMCRCAGIHDLAARVTRSRNPMNTVKAALQALRSQRSPDHEARALGRKLVDVRRVYYNGNT